MTHDQSRIFRTILNCYYHLWRLVFVVNRRSPVYRRMWGDFNVGAIPGQQATHDAILEMKWDE